MYFLKISLKPCKFSQSNMSEFDDYKVILAKFQDSLPKQIA